MLMGCSSPLLRPWARKPLKSVTHGQCNGRPTVTFPITGHRFPSTGTELYCLVTEAWPRVELATSRVASQRLHHYTTSYWWCNGVLYSFSALDKNLSLGWGLVTPSLPIGAHQNQVAPAETLAADDTHCDSWRTSAPLSVTWCIVYKTRTCTIVIFLTEMNYNRHEVFEWVSPETRVNFPNLRKRQIFFTAYCRDQTTEK